MENQKKERISELFAKDRKEFHEKNKKKESVESYKIDLEYNRINSLKDNEAATMAVTLQPHDKNSIMGLLDSLDSSFDTQSNSLPFLYMPQFEEVNISGPELVLVGALSGNGKSTLTANLCYQAVLKEQAVLILVNEEMIIDCYTRTACLFTGHNINKRRLWTAEDQKQVKLEVIKIAKYVTIISDNHQNAHGLTTTLEGISFLCDMIEKSTYDMVIIDYFQKIATSSKYPSLQKPAVLDKVTTRLDACFKIFGKPIILMSQLYNFRKGDRETFQERLCWCSQIYFSATSALEMVVDKNLLKTEFIVRKARWSEEMPTIQLGWGAGKLINYTPEFKNAVNLKAEKKKVDNLGK